MIQNKETPVARRINRRAWLRTCHWSDLASDGMPLYIRSLHTENLCLTMVVY